ncbi:hypothetical protein FRC17_008386 [Serendipita sp. 399]|nr:hypothetical protein FRC17_008386 [Serendipita sp. 399]
MNRAETRNEARADRRYGSQLPYGPKPPLKKPRTGPIGRAVGLVKKWSFFDFDTDINKSRDGETDAASSVSGREKDVAISEKSVSEASAKPSFTSRLRGAVNVGSSRGFTRHRMPGEFYKPKSRPSTPASASIPLPELPVDLVPEISPVNQEDRDEYTRYRVPGAFRGYTPQAEIRLGLDSAIEFRGLLGSKVDPGFILPGTEAQGTLDAFHEAINQQNEPDRTELDRETAKGSSVNNNARLTQGGADQGSDADIAEDESAVSALLSTQDNNPSAQEIIAGPEGDILPAENNDMTYHSNGSESNNRTDSGSDHQPSPTAPTYGLPAFYPDAAPPIVPPVYIEKREMTAEEMEELKAEFMSRDAEMRRLLGINYFECHEPEAWNELLRYKNPKNVNPSLADSSEEEEFDNLRLGKRRDPNEGFSIEEIMRNPYARISAFGDRPRSNIKDILDQMSKRQKTEMTENLKKQLKELNYVPPKPSPRPTSKPAADSGKKSVPTSSKEAEVASAPTKDVSSSKTKPPGTKGLMLPPPVPTGKGDRVPPPRLRAKPGQRNVLLAPLAQITRKPYPIDNPIDNEPTKDKPDDADSGKIHGKDFKSLKRDASQIVCVGGEDAFDPPLERPVKRRRSNGGEVIVDGNLEKTYMAHDLEDDIEMVYEAEEIVMTPDEDDDVNDDDLIDETPEPLASAPPASPPKPKALRRKLAIRSDSLRPKNSLHSPINPSPLRFMSKFAPDSPEATSMAPQAAQRFETNAQKTSVKGSTPIPPKSEPLLPADNKIPSFTFPIALLQFDSIGPFVFTEQLRRAKIEVASYPPAKLPFYPFDLGAATARRSESSRSSVSRRATSRSKAPISTAKSTSTSSSSNVRKPLKSNGAVKSTVPDSTIPPLRLPSSTVKFSVPTPSAPGDQAGPQLKPAPDSARRGFDWARAGLAPPTQADTWKCNTCLIGGNKGDKCMCCESPRPS